MKPKTIKQFIKQCANLADTDFDSLKGRKNITEQDEYDLKYIRAEIQNGLGDMMDLLQKFKIDYKP